MGLSGQPASGHRAFAFGAFVADTVTRRLWRDGQSVPISPKTFDVLIVLLEHRDRVVSKDELLDRVWPDTAVQENNLPRQVSSLRRLLGQRTDQTDYVVTVPGQGYRFVADAHGLPELPPELGDVHGSHALAASEPVGNHDDLAPDAPLGEHAVADVEGDPAEAAAPSGTAEERLPVGRLVAVAALLLALALGVTGLSRDGADLATPPALQRLTYRRRVAASRCVVVAGWPRHRVRKRPGRQR